MADGKNNRALAFVAIAVAAVVIGLLFGRSCHKSDDAIDAGTAAAVLDAGAAVAIADAGVVDAGAVAVAAVVDAGAAADALPIVAPRDHADRGSAATTEPHGRHAREKAERIAKAEPEKVAKADALKVAKAEPAKDEPAKVEPAKVEPATADAKVAKADVADAGVVDAGAPAKLVAAEVKAPVASAPITVAYTDSVSTWLKLAQVRVFIDGKRVADDNDDKGINASSAKGFYEGALTPGTHQVRVETMYIGKANGIFSYMEGIKLRVRGMTLVEAAEGKKLRVDAIAYDKGALEQFENRVGLKFTVAR